VKSIKDHCKKYTGYLKGRLQTKNASLRLILFSAFYRSLLIYYLVPLFAAGAITENEVAAFET